LLPTIGVKTMFASPAFRWPAFEVKTLRISSGSAVAHQLHLEVVAKAITQFEEEWDRPKYPQRRLDERGPTQHRDVTSFLLRHGDQSIRCGVQYTAKSLDSDSSLKHALELLQRDGDVTLNRALRNDAHSQAPQHSGGFLGSFDPHSCAGTFGDQLH
jgi:hypothetical protein